MKVIVEDEVVAGSSPAKRLLKRWVLVYSALSLYE